MIWLDDRVGSKELKPYFRPYGVPVVIQNMEFADLCWVGNGPDGECMVGVERKRIGDLVSSITTRRLSGHQLPGMMKTYEYVYLQVEGMFRPGKKGELEVWAGRGWVMSGGRIMYREVDNYLNTLEAKCGVIVHRAGTVEESVHQLVDLYRWWTDKKWDKHQSHNQLYAPTPAARRLGWHYVEPTLVEKVAAQLPGIDRKAKEVSKQFRTVQQMVDAGVRDWMKVPGVGKVLAGRLTKILKGR